DHIRPRLVLEDRVRVGRGCQFTVVGEVVVEEDALIGDFVQIGDTAHLYEARIRAGTAARPQPTRACAGAILNSHVVVLPGGTVAAHRRPELAQPLPEDRVPGNGRDRRGCVAG